MQLLRVRQPSEQLGVHILLAAKHDDVLDSIRPEAQAVDNARTVDRCTSQEPQSQRVAAHRHATEMMTADQMNGRLDRVDAKRPGFLQFPGQNIERLAQPWIFVREM